MKFVDSRTINSLRSSVAPAFRPLPIPLNHAVGDVLPVAQGRRATRPTVGTPTAARATVTHRVVRARTVPRVARQGLANQDLGNLIVGLCGLLRLSRRNAEHQRGAEGGQNSSGLHGRISETIRIAMMRHITVGTIGVFAISQVRLARLCRALPREARELQATLARDLDRYARRGSGSLLSRLLGASFLRAGFSWRRLQPICILDKVLPSNPYTIPGSCFPFAPLKSSFIHDQVSQVPAVVVLNLQLHPIVFQLNLCAQIFYLYFHVKIPRRWFSNDERTPRNLLKQLLDPEPSGEKALRNSAGQEQQP